MHPISVSVGLNSLNLLLSWLLYRSYASEFYVKLFIKDNELTRKSPVGRATSFANMYVIDSLHYVFNIDYKKETVKKLKVGVPDAPNGLPDSIRLLLTQYYVDNARDINKTELWATYTHPI